jgi:hypothetical protein
MNLENIETLHKCDCVRPHCDFFNGAEGESGYSYSRIEVENNLRDLKENGVRKVKKAIKHLESLLTPSNN